MADLFIQDCVSCKDTILYFLGALESQGDHGVSFRHTQL